MPQNGTKRIFSDKQTTKKVPLTFLDLRVLGKGKNDGFRRCKQTRKAQSMYFTFKSVKISSK